MSNLRFLSKCFRDSGRRGGLPPRRPVRARLAVRALADRNLPSAPFVQTNLVSALPGVARVQDPSLVGPIGIAPDTIDPASRNIGVAVPAFLSHRGEVFALGGNSLNRT